MVLYLFLSIGFVMMTNSNYFIDPSLFQIYSESGIYFYLILSACVLVIGILVYVAERIISRKSKHIFLFYFGFLASSFYVFMFINLPFIEFYLLLLIPIGLLMGLFAYRLIWKSTGQIRQKMLIVTIGYITFIIAIVLLIRFILSVYSLPFDYDLYTIPLEIKFLILIAAVLAGYGFKSIPSFTEFDWKDKIRHLYILSPQGICLFQHSFRSEAITDEDLLGGSLMAINTLIQEIIKTDKTLRVIDQEDAKIIFETSPNANCVIVVDEDLYVIRQKIKEVMKGFDLIFGETMKEWEGEIHIFRSLQPLINRIFETETKKDEKWWLSSKFLN